MVRRNSAIEESLHILWQADFFKALTFPTSPIGPFEILWETDQDLWVICHPLLKDSILECIGDELNPEVIESELVMFEILGAKSTEVIRDVLHPIGETEASLAELIASLPSPAALPPGFSIAYIASDRRSVQDHFNTPGSTFDFTNVPFQYCGSPLFDNLEYPLKSDKEFNRERSKLLFPKSCGPSGHLPVLLMQQFSAHPNGFGAAWRVVLRFGSGAIAFRQFIARGVRPFGLDCSV
jgi:hypothetical protein